MTSMFQNVLELQDRCLFHAAKWLLEQLPNKEPATFTINYNATYELAKSYFQLHEYSRAHACLSKMESTDNKHRFLRLYALYMAGEKAKDERSKGDWFSISTTSVKTVNVQLTEMEQELGADFSSMDSYLLYLYGVVCKNLKLDIKAQSALIQSVLMNPWNWSAWLELQSFVTSVSKMNQILDQLPINHVMTKCFQIQISIESEIYPLETLLALCNAVDKTFPQSQWLIAQKALIYYNHKDFDETEQIMEKCQKMDPFNLDYVDTYSNVLYVKGKQPELSILAQHVFELDRYRPESCNVIGNFYSLRGEREKAISYFNRAVRLDPHYLSAWTLLGHEYIELKNWNAAIAAYRRAVDIGPKDYRAWFGLGRAYELLKMPHYAIFYMQKAAALKPYDSRIWQALGDVYRNISKQSAALTCYKRSLTGSEVVNPSIFASIGRLYSEQKNSKKEAATWFQLFMEDGRGIEKDIEFACSFLCEYFMGLKDYKRANQYLEEILHTEEGKVIQRELRCMEKNNEKQDRHAVDWI